MIPDECRCSRSFWFMVSLRMGFLERLGGGAAVHPIQVEEVPDGGEVVFTLSETALSDN